MCATPPSGGEWGGGWSRGRGVRSGARLPAARPHLATHENTVQDRPERSKEALVRRQRRRRRYRLRGFLWQESSIRRVRLCGRVPARGNPTGPRAPEVRLAGGVAHYAGVGRCGSVWACPVCSPKIRHGRAQEADQMMQSWLGLHWGDGRSCDLSDRGPTGQVLFLTLTLPHDFGEACADLLTTIKLGWRAVFSGRRWQEDKERFRVAHYIRAIDITYGRNGWHPHFHVALFVEVPLSASQISELADRIYGRYADAVEKRGHRRPSRKHGIDLEPARCASDLSRYLAKVEGVRSGTRIALELMRGDLKEGRIGGRTPFEILASAAATGDAEDLAGWHEWEKATKGSHFMQCSRGLRRVTATPERTDEAIVEEEVGGEVVYTFGPPEWAMATRRRGGLIDVLDAAEAAGRKGVEQLILGWMGRVPPLPRPVSAPP